MSKRKNLGPWGGTNPPMIYVVELILYYLKLAQHEIPWFQMPTPFCAVTIMFLESKPFKFTVNFTLADPGGIALVTGKHIPPRTNILGVCFDV